jgi:glycine dehydrogenase subunit 1
MTFNPHTDADRAEMLRTIGAESIEELFAPIPADVRFPTLDLLPQLTEMEAAARLSELAGKNVFSTNGNTFLGAGSYNHYVHATVGQILSRGEFYTAYTPYQPEVAQGTLQVIYEFQSMVASLFGMDVANASMYDGATALAEAVLMAVSSVKKRHKVILSGTVHPAYREVIHTYASGLPIDLVDLPVPTDGFVTTLDTVNRAIDDEVAAVVVQYPNFFGGIEELAAMADAVHAAGALLVVATYPVPLGLLTPPGDLGADIVTAEGQSLGVAQSFGGPYVGLLATRQSFVRLMPGRLAGIANDSEGKRGFVLTLQTREQHIRREKATSNICTNQGLMATAATVYMASVGPEGFREVANRSYQNAHYLQREICALPGFQLALDAPFFHEFVVRTPEPAAAINAKLREAGIIGGYDLATVDPSLDHHLMLCATELNGKASIDRLIEAIS